MWVHQEKPGMCMHRGKNMWGHSKKTSICKPKREAPEKKTCQHLDPGLPASRTMGKYVSIVEGSQSVEFCYSGPSRLMWKWMLSVFYLTSSSQEQVFYREQKLDLNKIKTNQVLIRIWTRYAWALCPWVTRTVQRYWRSWWWKPFIGIFSWVGLLLSRLVVSTSSVLLLFWDSAFEILLKFLAGSLWDPLSVPGILKFSSAVGLFSPYVPGT